MQKHHLAPAFAEVRLLVRVYLKALSADLRFLGSVLVWVVATLKRSLEKTYELMIS